MSDASLLFAKNFLGTTYDKLPAEVIKETKNQVLDFLGVAIGGSAKEGANELRELYGEWGGAAQSTVWGYKNKFPAPHAAQINATFGHSLDYDDVHEAATMHPGVITIPTSIALAEYLGGLSGKDFIQGVAVGGDMISRLGLATHPGKDIHGFGWHFTTMNGFLVSAALAAKLLGLSEQEIVYAIGIGYHQVSGNGQPVRDGVLTKRLGPGFSVKGGMTAALLAQKGVTGAVNSITDGECSYYKVYHGNDYSEEKLLGGLGERFENVNISIKPYPACRGTHTYIDCALQVKEAHGIDPAQVEEILLYVGEGTRHLLCEPLEFKTAPRNPVDAQFSVPWGVATAIAVGTPGLAHYTDTAIKDEAILAIGKKIKLVDEPKFAVQGLPPAALKVILKDGTQYDGYVELALGSPGNMLSYEQVEAKFRDLIKMPPQTISKENADNIVAFVKDLENQPDVTKLLDYLVWE
jgi:2-methylcitrate dehydratase PrpD